MRTSSLQPIRNYLPEASEVASNSVSCYVSCSCSSAQLFTGSQ